MNGGGHGVDESLISVRREIGGDLCAWRDRSRNLDVQLDFTVSAARVTRGGIAPPSTETAVTCGGEMPRLLKKESRSLVL